MLPCQPHLRVSRIHPTLVSLGFRIGAYRRSVPLLPATVRLVLSRIGWFFATGDERDAEILALRHQIVVLQRQINRPRFTEADRTILAVLSGVFDRRRLGDVFLIVKPDTVIGWHRRLVARHWTQPPSQVRAPAGDRGDPPARDPDGEREPDVGVPPCPRRDRASRVPGSRRHRCGTSCAVAGIDPTPNRTGPSWAEFIRSQAKAVIATRFLVRRHRDPAPAPRAVLHRGRLATGSSGRDHHQSDRAWTTQAARNLADGSRPLFRFVVHDGAGQYSGTFDTVFTAAGMTAITTLRVPNTHPTCVSGRSGGDRRWVASHL